MTEEQIVVKPYELLINLMFVIRNYHHIAYAICAVCRWFLTILRPVWTSVPR